MKVKKKPSSLHQWIEQRSIGRTAGVSAASDLGSPMSCQLYSSLECVRTWIPSKTVADTHHGGIFNFDFTSDGSVMAAACEKKSVLLFDPVNGSLIGRRNNAHNDCVNCVRFLDARMFATCSDDTSVCLWDLRNLSHQVCVLRGHTNWVKNIEYLAHSGSLLTSSFDGVVNVWDINSCAEGAVGFQRALRVDGLMRCRVLPDGSKLVVSTSDGFLLVVHDLNLDTLCQDLSRFRAQKYHHAQTGQSVASDVERFNKLFTARRNRVEIISDFPVQNDAGMITSLDVHPHGWCVASRNTSQDEASEWTCVHDIQGVPSDVKCGLYKPVVRPRNDVSRFFMAMSDNWFSSQPLRTVASLSNGIDGSLPRAAAGGDDAVDERLRTNGDSDTDDDDVSENDDDEDREDDSDGESPASFLRGLLRWSPDRRRSGTNATTTTERHELYRVEVPHLNGVSRDGGSRTTLVIASSSVVAAATAAAAAGSVDRVASHNDSAVSMSLEQSTSGSRTQPDSDAASIGRRVSSSMHVDGSPLSRTESTRSASVSICQPCRRLSHYVDEPVAGRGFIKEISFGVGGRVIASPFAYGVRLLAFDADCKELCDCVEMTSQGAAAAETEAARTAVQLREVVTNVCHGSVVVTTKFAPGDSLLVSGSLGGKVCFHQPRW